MKPLLSRRSAIVLGAAGLTTLATPLRAAAQTVRVGYAIARSGPFAPGAQATQEPNYIMWMEQLNAKGGLLVDGVRRKVELVGYDDRSDVDTGVRTYEKLVTSDKVDLLLPPWGTDMTFPVATLANRYQYPLLAPTALSLKLIDMKLPYFFSMLQQPDRLMTSLVQFLAANHIKTVALVNVDDLFGLESVQAFNRSLNGSGISVVYHTTYPLGVKDLTSVMSAVKSAKPDAFIGLSYPSDSILLSTQAKEVGFNPKLFLVSVGTAFPLFPQALGADAQGVVGMSAWNRKSSPQAAAFAKTFQQRWHRDADRWACGVCWASLQILQQAVEHVGLDREKLRAYIASTTFQTLIGAVRFQGSENVTTPGMFSQWQGKEFEIVWPKDRSTSHLVIPKPSWT